MTKMERFSVEQEENTIGIITGWVSLWVCVGCPPLSILIHCSFADYSVCVCVGVRVCVTYRKLYLHFFLCVTSLFAPKPTPSSKLIIKIAPNSLFYLNMCRKHSRNAAQQLRRKKWDGKLVISYEMNEWLGQEHWIPHVNEKQQKNPKEVTSHWL